MTTGIAAIQLANMSEDQLYESLGAIHKESKAMSFRLLSLNAQAADVAVETDNNAGRLFFKLLNKQAYDFFAVDVVRPITRIV